MAQKGRQIDRQCYESTESNSFNNLQLITQNTCPVQHEYGGELFRKSCGDQISVTHFELRCECGLHSKAAPRQGSGRGVTLVQFAARQLDCARMAHSACSMAMNFPGLAWGSLGSFEPATTRAAAASPVLRLRRVDISCLRVPVLRRVKEED